MTEKTDLEIISGNIIKVDEDQVEVLKTLCETLDKNKILAGILMNKAASDHDAAEKEFWKSINAIFPELENWSFSVKADEGKLFITRPLTVREKEIRDKRLED